jgi:hypothetical protein
MNTEERKAKMQRMRRVVKENNICRWASTLIAELVPLNSDESRERAGSAGAFAGSGNSPRTSRRNLAQDSFDMHRQFGRHVLFGIFETAAMDHDR